MAGFEDGCYYLVSSDVTNNNRINVTGTAVLTLGAGTTLNAAAGIHVGEGASLTIRGTGTLTAKVARTMRVSAARAALPARLS